MFTLEKPNLTLADTVKVNIILRDRPFWFWRLFVKYSEQKYLYWDDIKYERINPQEVQDNEIKTIWAAIKDVRKIYNKNTVIKKNVEDYFVWHKLDYFDEFFHELDMKTGGELLVDKSEGIITNKQKLIAHGIMEEAIASSQLEGAATSRQAAKKMLQEGRKAVNASEQMIVNNHLAMRAVEEEYKNKKLDMELILSLHHLLTKNTVDSANEEPRLRKDGEEIYVSDKNITYYKAPDMKFVKEELEHLIAFANDELKNEGFIHPVIKATMLHFWIGYLHPFTDGNGRFARLLFYWYLLKKGYWAFAYLPISKVIKRSPQQYIMAYVYSEQDDNDLTYFIDYSIKKIKQAIQDFDKYLKEKSNSNVQMKKKSELTCNLNMRQVQLLQYLYGAKDEHTSLKTHMNINQVTKSTAIRDLKDLVKKGFLVATKQGRNIYYYGTEEIKNLF